MGSDEKDTLPFSSQFSLLNQTKKIQVFMPLFFPNKHTLKHGRVSCQTNVTFLLYYFSLFIDICGLRLKISKSDQLHHIISDYMILKVLKLFNFISQKRKSHGRFIWMNYLRNSSCLSWTTFFTLLLLSSCVRFLVWSHVTWDDESGFFKTLVGQICY